MKNIIASAGASFERYRICTRCPEFNSKIAQCKKCGCFMKLKVKLRDSICPLRKWLPENEKWMNDPQNAIHIAVHRTWKKSGEN